MSDAQAVLSAVLTEIERAHRIVMRHKARQVTNRDDRDLLKSVAYSWFQSHRPSLSSTSSSPDLSLVDEPFRVILEATDRASSRTTYLDALKQATSRVRALRGAFLIPVSAPTSDAAPDFSPLAGDAAMRSILVGRWEECQRCLQANAHLAATVMMGGLLDALFVARANAMTDKRPLFKAKTTPLDSKTKKPLPLRDWTLRPYIDVAQELGWITRSGKDIAAVLRDYRNLVHPEKQRSMAITLNEHDSQMFWEITKSLSRQLVASI